MKKPEPVIITTICSLCDQPWEAHGDKPTTEDCIRLLKAEIARRPSITITHPVTYPPLRPYWQYQYPNYGTVCTTDTASGFINTSATAQNVIEFKRPEDPPDAVPARVG